LKTIYHQIQSLLDADLTIAVATITAVKGSVPREVGAKMIIHPYGKHLGTVGGGCGEADVIRAGLDVIADGVPRVVHVDLTEEISMRSLGVCGGIMDVYVERWAPDEAAPGELAPAGEPVSAPAGGGRAPG
jgi:xanthine dehydrogenase accessory factor